VYAVQLPIFITSTNPLEQAKLHLSYAIDDLYHRWKKAAWGMLFYRNDLEIKLNKTPFLSILIARSLKENNP
jgi:hypothetical protein